jgi:hypothetical protein
MVISMNLVVHGGIQYYALYGSPRQQRKKIYYQYQAAKTTIRTKMNIPKCPLLAELGWELINAFLDRQRFSFFLRFSKISNNRLSKVVFHELSRFNLIQPTISLEMPVPSQGHYGFHSFPAVD